MSSLTCYKMHVILLINIYYKTIDWHLIKTGFKRTLKYDYVYIYCFV